MRSIGFRCWNDRFAFVVLEGTQKKPTMLARDVRHSPKNVNRAQFLAWVRSSVQELLTIHEPTTARFKVTEGVAPKKDLRRAEVEGVLQEAAYSHRSRLVVLSRLSSQIKKDIEGFDERARYFKKVLDSAELPELKSANFQEAALVAVCGLPAC